MKVVTWLYWIRPQIYEISANDIAEITTENSKDSFRYLKQNSL
jgi:hypothetical protein